MTWALLGTAACAGVGALLMAFAAGALVSDPDAEGPHQDHAIGLAAALAVVLALGAAVLAHQAGGAP